MGVLVQVTSRPLVIVSAPLPVPKVFFQPSPWLLKARPASGSTATLDAGAAPCVLAEGVAARNQGDGLFVVHRHATEGVADVVGGGYRIRVARPVPRG